MSQLDDDIKLACEAVGAIEKQIKETSTDNSDAFHVELREALWLALRGGMKLQEVLGDVRRQMVDLAKEMDETKAATAVRLGIDVRTLFRVEQHRHKF